MTSNSYHPDLDLSHDPVEILLFDPSSDEIQLLPKELEHVTFEPPPKIIGEVAQDLKEEDLKLCRHN